jgi:hypothetical protein
VGALGRTSEANIGVGGVVGSRHMTNKDRWASKIVWRPADLIQLCLTVWPLSGTPASLGSQGIAVDVHGPDHIGTTDKTSGDVTTGSGADRAGETEVSGKDFREEVILDEADGIRYCTYKVRTIGVTILQNKLFLSRAGDLKGHAQ